MNRPDLRSEWNAAWKDRSFRRQFVVTLLVLVPALVLFAKFLDFVELRPGVVLPDPILQYIEPRDFTWVSFTLIYAGLVCAIVLLSRYPRHLLLALQSYVVMMGLRFVAMYLMPLEAPTRLIPLADPFVQYFGTSGLPTKDLFFSGHTATLVLLGLVMPSGRWRAVFFCAAAAVGVIVVLQHVHYVIDVFTAPFFSYAAYRVAALHAPSLTK